MRLGASGVVSGSDVTYEALFGDSSHPTFPLKWQQQSLTYSRT